MCVFVHTQQAENWLQQKTIHFDFNNSTFYFRQRIKVRQVCVETEINARILLLSWTYCEKIPEEIFLKRNRHTRSIAFPAH